MKQAIKTDELKDDVDNCNVFCRLSGVNPSALFAGADVDDAFLKEVTRMTGHKLEEKKEDIWYCIGNHMWSPCRSTFKLMVRITASREDERTHADEVFLMVRLRESMNDEQG